MRRLLKKLSVFCFFATASILFIYSPKATASTGTIDPNNDGSQYAVIDADDSQINFGCSNCGVSVTDSAVTGNAWSTNYGWINLQPTNGGVVNDGSGVLSGEAWGENTGWVNFDPANGGVSIVNGSFTGTAWSEVVGWIVFDCGNASSCVYTSWEENQNVGPGGGGGDNACEDTNDNDADGYVDYPEDLGCTGSNDNNESFAGCTDDSSLNFNIQANTDDGSCIYIGCTDPTADNYNNTADVNDGSCVYTTTPTENDILGCTDPTATNYNPLATVNNLTCFYPEIPITGCTNINATNYNSNANIDNGTCIFPPEPPIIIPTTEEIISNIKDTAINIGSNPNTLPILGLLLPLFIYFLADPNRSISLVAIPIRTWSMIPVWFGIRKRRRPWGTVYDSVTKQPLDPVYVKLIKGHKEVQSSITDIDGRFGFLADLGIYNIVAKKDGYIFPSKILADRKRDIIYENIYHGEEININKKGELLIKNIPMDRINFNWNEFEKAKNQKLMKYFHKRNVVWGYISNIAFTAGFVIAIISFTTKSTLLNTVILSAYGVLTVLQFFGVYPKSPGYIIDKKTSSPLGFAIIRVFSETLKKEVKMTVANDYGKYYILINSGKYYITIEKKTGIDTYENVFKSEPFEVRGGYISNTWEID